MRLLGCLLSLTAAALLTGTSAQLMALRGSTGMALGQAGAADSVGVLVRQPDHSVLRRHCIRLGLVYA